MTEAVRWLLKRRVTFLPFLLLLAAYMVVALLASQAGFRGIQPPVSDFGVTAAVSLAAAAMMVASYWLWSGNKGRAGREMLAWVLCHGVGALGLAYFFLAGGLVKLGLFTIASAVGLFLERPTLVKDMPG